MEGGRGEGIHSRKGVRCFLLGFEVWFASGGGGVVLVLSACYFWTRFFFSSCRFFFLGVFVNESPLACCRSHHGTTVPCSLSRDFFAMGVAADAAAGAIPSNAGEKQNAKLARTHAAHATHTHTRALTTKKQNREEQQELASQRNNRMSDLLKKRARERAQALERRARGEDGSGDEGGEEVDELAAYEVRAGSCGRFCVPRHCGARWRVPPSTPGGFA